MYRGVDGVLIIAGPDIAIKESIDSVISSDIPKISIESLYDNVTTVLSSNYTGTTDILNHLYKLNHKSIGLIYVNDNSTATSIRYNAYINFLNKHNIPINNNHIIPVTEYSVSAGSTACDALMKNGKENLPDAIFCICDEIAIGLINKFHEYYIKVPENISICGFDDIKSAEFFSLTTIKQNKKLIGSRASQELIKIINSNNYSPESHSKIIEIDTDLIVRNTTKKRR